MLSCHRLAAGLVPLLVAVALPAAAAADSIVYLKGGQVWVAGPDGSGARQFTVHPYGWSSPSEADDGTVVVAGGLARINADGSDSDGSSELYRFRADGNQRGSFTPTWGSYSTPACPTYPPESVRVSPDGSRIAYGIWSCGAFDYTALWTPAGSTNLSFPSQVQGQVDFYEPHWVDNSQFLVTHAGPTVTSTQTQWFVHDIGAGDDVGTGWYESGVDGTGFEGVVSRAGDEMVVFENDAADWLDGKPRSVNLWLYTSTDLATAETDDWDLRCTVALSAAATTDPGHLSPSLSPDGTKVLWGDDHGVEVASLADPADCASIVPHLLVAGGSQPFYAKGNVQPGAANPTQPGGTDPGGTTGGTTPGGTAPGGTTPGGTTPGGTTPGGTTPTALTPHARFKLRTKHARRRHKVVFDARKSSEAGGEIVSYRWKFGDGKHGKGRKVRHRYRKAGRYTVRLTIRDAAGTRAKLERKVRVRRH